jgi:hypothetical protein
MNVKNNLLSRLHAPVDGSSQRRHMRSDTSMAFSVEDHVYMAGNYLKPATWCLSPFAYRKRQTDVLFNNAVRY